MENEAGNRRLNVITAHLAPADDFSATFIKPLNCSSYLTSVIQRGDNRVNFARQGSDSQSTFMRQASIGGGNSTRFSLPLKSTTASFEPSLYASEGPLFSRPAEELRIPSFGIEQPAAQNFSFTESEPPLFSRASCGISEQPQFISKIKLPSSGSKGNVWSPKMDVAESGGKYVLTVEIPGVKISDIRVEIDDQKLTVTGNRSSQYNKIGGYPNDSISSYHKREISLGPYQVNWPLPINVNKDGIFAEFCDGFLLIILPKL